MIRREVQVASASAPGKLILMGEHAVVYGGPAVVASIGLRCAATITRRDDLSVQLDLPDVDVRTACAWDALRGYALKARARWDTYATQNSPLAFTHLRGMDPAHLVKVVLGEVTLQFSEHHLPGAAVALRSTIPVGAGFGSSAAVAVSLAAALLALLGLPPSSPSLRDIALAAERRQHGHPSGIDHTTVLFGGMVRAAPDASGALRAEPIAMTRTVRERLFAHASVYHTGSAAESTGAVVTAVRHRLNGAGRGLLRSMNQATDDLLTLVDAPDAAEITRVVDIVRRYASCLDALGVVPAEVQRAIRAVEQAGGAAKICGAGALTGQAAGALLVVWPDPPPDPLPVLLTRYPRVRAPLAVPGCSVQTA